ncbi:hypothetical protein OP864_14990 [Saprospira grandis]|nr:hypothetical protein [Saprospira grandis]WBM76307.1 hypothetical protein OP864_14990 [Saprospira grandis]
MSFLSFLSPNFKGGARFIFVFWGLPPAAAGPLQGSQVCSALRRFQRLGLACGHPFRPLGRLAFGHGPSSRVFKRDLS